MLFMKNYRDKKCSKKNKISDDYYSEKSFFEKNTYKKSNSSRSKIMNSQVLVGSSGVINVQNMPWLNSEVTKGTKRNQKKMTIKSGYEIFAQYANMTEDPYWKKLFNRASTGRLPSSLRLIKDQLVYRYKKKKSNISLSSGPYEIMNFMSTKLGIRSQHDVDADSNVYNAHRTRIDDVSYKSWGELKSNGVKRQLVVSFCTEKKMEYNLSGDEYRKLKSLLNINLSLDKITHNDVIMENKFIKEIRNLVWIPSIRKFTIITDKTDYTSQTIVDIENIVDPYNKQYFNVHKKIKLMTWKEYLNTLKKANHIITSSYVPSSRSYGTNTPSVQSSGVSVNTTPISCDLNGFMSPVYTPTIMSP